MIDPKRIIGIVIAGGQATRMGGGDKTLLTLGGVPILATLLDKLAKQTASAAINSNSDAANFAAFNVPVFSDSGSAFAGPLAGILASMRWARDNHPEATHIATVAGDSPFFPDDLVPRLVEQAPDGNTIMMAASDGHNHPVFGLWPIDLQDALQTWLDETGILKVMAWVRTQPHVMVDFTTAKTPDPFFNINTPEDLAHG
ncbi:MAG: molybdenum cofactor guanylyltransferase MobA [Ahrensia sp.]|nr:molybdenum cofactor guanylyltransferase MobA [Ahrensia sp.]